MKYFKGKKIWITGASSGIGKALVGQLSTVPCTLVISSRNTEALNKIQQDNKGLAKIKVVPLDLEAISGHSSLVNKLIQDLQNIDIVVLNAGISQRSLVETTVFSVYQKMMQVNYFGNISITKALLPFIKKQKSGHFVVVTSLTGKFGTPYRSGYAASKHALHGFFESLYLEEYQNGVDVTLVCPGFVKTQLSYNALTENNQPLNQLDQAQANGMAPSIFANKMLRAIEKRKYEVYIGGKETIGIYLKRISTQLFLWAIKRSSVR